MKEYSSSPVCVKDKEGIWCLTELKEITEGYCFKLACGWWLALPIDMDKRLPTCKKCLEIYKRGF
jgi:hypothetical protein